MSRDNIADIYPLSPTQQGILFHSLYDPASGVYCQQFTCRLDGDLDPTTFRQAWQQILDRHPSLRTAFFWEETEETLQVVLHHVTVPLLLEDWRDLPAEARAERLDALLREDRVRGFALDEAPLMRLFLARLAEDSYQFVWSFHHLLLDGWSLPLVLQEFLQRYEALQSGRPAALPPVRPYGDFIAWLLGQDLSKAETAWRQALRGFTVPTPIAAGPAPVGQEGYGEQVLQLQIRETEALQGLARQHQLTLNTLLQGAWALLLNRYSGEDEVLFGATVSGRPGALSGVDQMVGLFINTLPVRVRVPPDAPLTAWLRDLQARQAELRQYDYSPLYQVQAWSDLPRGQALFDSILVFENQPLDASLQHPGGPLQPGETRFMEQTNYPLTLVAVPGPALTIKLVYDRQRFSEAAIGQMLGHLRTLLGGFAAAEQDAPLVSLPLLTEAEQVELMERWATGEPAAALDCIHRLFEQQAGRTPDAIAVTFQEQQLTYRALNDRANQLAHALRHLGVGPEVVVGICMERSLELVLAILGILKAGGAYLPLDPVYPPERLTFMLADARAPVLLTQESLAASLSGYTGTVIRLDTDWAGIGTHSTANPIVADLNPESLCYVIYTSGSTGEPKGTLVTHANVVRLFSATEAWFGFGATDVWTLFHSHAFDFSVWELWGALLYGGRLVVVPYWVSRSPEAFHALLRREGVTVLNQTPSAFRGLIHADGAPEAGPLPALRLIIFGGEKLEPELLRPWFNRHGDQRPQLVNMYGITETTVHVTYRPLTTADLAGAHGSVIGRPIADLQLLLLDRHLRPVPVGVPGEICVGGAGVARGYLNRPELTAARFIEWAGGSRLYRSGDLARYLPDGDLEYLGRMDSQVKVRGHRVELGEIEAALLCHPAVREAVVLPAKEGRLAAYIVPTAGEAPQAVRDLRHFLRSRLPEYMIPTAFIPLERLPLTPNGKLDRRALPEPDHGRPIGDGAVAVPRTGAEAQLLEIWQRVLGVTRIGIHDNFFELGGDSILSIQLVARAAQAGLRLTPRQVFQHPTIAGQAAVAGSAMVVQAVQEPVTGKVPLTPIQHWFFAQDLPEPHHWNQAVLLEVSAAYPDEVWSAALRTLLSHHDGLRLRFTRDASGAWQQVNAPVDGAVPFIREELAAKSVMAARSAYWQASLNLAEGPLMRAVLFDAGPDRPDRLLVILHHLVADTVSWRILLEDLQNLLAGRSLPPKTTAYREWAERLAAHAASPDIRGELDFWLTAQRGVPHLPVDLAAGANSEGSVETVSVSLTPAETEALLQRVPAAYRTRIDDLLLTALLRVIANWTGGDAMLVDLESHGREALFEDVDLSRTVGWFTAICPVRLELGGLTEPGLLLKSVKEQLRHVPHRGIGYGLLRYLTDGPEAHQLARLPQPELSFNYYGQFDQTLPAEGPFHLTAQSAGPLRSPAAPRRHLLAVNAGVAGGQLHMEFTYSACCHRRTTMAGLADTYLAALRSLIAHCCSPEAGGFTPSDFPLAGLTQPQVDQLALGCPGLADLHPLSPAQQGILLQSLLEPDTYIVQVVGQLGGRLDQPAFQQAWQTVMDRHAILRGAPVWAGLPEPLLAVRRTVRLPVTCADWRGADENRLEAFLAEDRALGFTLTDPPLMRLALLRTGEDRHLLVWTFHHLLLDGWSVPILLKELFTSYEAICQGEQANLPPVPPYQEFVAWVRRQDMGAAERFWRRHLQGFTVPTPLAGADQADPDTAGHAEQQLHLSPSLTVALQNLGRANGLTLNTLVHGAWALLLSRYSGEADVRFGTTVAGRPHDLEGVEQMVGMFIATLPVRTRVDPNADLLPWLQELQALQAEIRQYEYTPLTQIRAWSEVPAGQPLFDSLVVFENYPAAAALEDAAGSLDLQAVRTEEHLEVPVTLIAEPGPELILRLLYRPARLPPAAAGRLLQHLQMLLTAMAEQPCRTLSALPMLQPAEREQILTEWAGPESVNPPDRCIHQLFEAQAARTPDAVAVLAETGSLTYAELDRRAGLLARVLAARGVGPDVLVGICTERTPAMVVAVLGVLKAGGAYVPLDPTYPPDRIAYIAADARMPVILTQRSLLERLPAHKAGVLCLDDPLDAAGAPPAQTATPANLAYVIYTSGSTGTPKGVAIEHRNAAAFLRWALAHFSPAELAGTLFATSLCFDLSVFELFAPLCCGGTAILADNALHLLTLQARGRVTLINTVPSAMAELLRAGGLPPSVRTVNLAGEPLPEALARQLYAQTQTGRLCNLYGPTETTTYSTWELLPRHGGSKPSIGRPIAGTQVYLLDHKLEPVPAGMPGELFIGGDGVARGYLGRPDLTAERFVANPFRPGTLGERLYRTGDLARWLPDGRLDFLGRKDHQIKLRGYRIELGEIEAVLRQHPAVQDTAVTARPDLTDDQRLVAYVVAGTVPPGELRAWLGKHLPAYMVPSRFVSLDALPLTPNGKVDRKALPAPDSRRPELPGIYAAPQTDVEQSIARVWQTGLGLEQVGLDDNFFDLGGHSLLAVRLHGDLQAALSQIFPLLHLFQYPTIRLLARALTRPEDGAPVFDAERERARRQREALGRRRSAPDTPQGR